MALKIPDELFFKATPLTIYRESMLQEIMKNFRSITMVARAITYQTGKHDDIRPAWFTKCGVVSHMEMQYELPTITIPCVVRVDAWIMDAYRKYLSDIYLPEFG